MAYALRNTTSQGNVSGGALTVTKPTGTVDGDLIVVVGYLETASNSWSSVGSGFALARAEQVVSTEFRLGVWWKIAGGEPASWTWTPASSGWRTIVAGSYSGGSGSAPFVDATSGNGGTGALNTAQTAPSVNATANDLLVYGYGNFSGTNVVTMSGAATNLRVSFGGCTIADLLSAAGGATGTSNPNSGPGTDDFAAQHAAFLLVGSGGGAASLILPSPRMPFAILAR